MKIFEIFKRKRKQCINCKKTFYKSVKAFHAKKGCSIDIIVFDASPCCLRSYIIV